MTGNQDRPSPEVWAAAAPVLAELVRRHRERLAQQNEEAS